MDVSRVELDHIVGADGLARDLLTGGADHPAARDSHPHPVAPEVGEELARDMKLVAVPPRLALEDTDFGEPLGDHVEVAGKSGSCDHPRQAGLEVELQLHRLTGQHLPRKLDTRHGEVVLVTVVGPLEAQPGHQIRAIGQCETSDPGPPPSLVEAFASTQRIARELAHEGALGARERVEIEVEPDLRGGHTGGVPPPNALRCRRARESRDRAQPRCRRKRFRVLAQRSASPIEKGIRPRSRRGFSR